MIHILKHGFAVCGLGLPREWAQGERWVGFDSPDVLFATCPDCKAGRNTRTKMEAYPFPLRPGLVIEVALPADFSASDARRMSRWLETLPIPEEPASPFPGEPYSYVVTEVTPHADDFVAVVCEPGSVGHALAEMMARPGPREVLRAGDEHPPLQPGEVRQYVIALPEDPDPRLCNREDPVCCMNCGRGLSHDEPCPPLRTGGES